MTNLPQVLNAPPVFTKEKPISFIMYRGQVFDYLLPEYYDPEGMPVTVTIEARPPDIIQDFADILPGAKVIRFTPDQEKYV